MDGFRRGATRTAVRPDRSGRRPTAPQTPREAGSRSVRRVLGSVAPRDCTGRPRGGSAPDARPAKPGRAPAFSTAAGDARFCREVPRQPAPPRQVRSPSGQSQSHGKDRNPPLKADAAASPKPLCGVIPTICFRPPCAPAAGHGMTSPLKKPAPETRAGNGSGFDPNPSARMCGGCNKPRHSAAPRRPIPVRPGREGNQPLAYCGHRWATRASAHPIGKAAAGAYSKLAAESCLAKSSSSRCTRNFAPRLRPVARASRP